MRLHRLPRSCLLIAALALLAVFAAGCGSSKKSSSSSSNDDQGCARNDLQLVSSGKLTIGTDNPAFPPWFGGTPAKGSTWKVSDPNSGQGFEGAVAAVLASKLGFPKDEVKWVVVPFDQSFKPGSKNFDFDINQVSYTPQRAKSVDLSDSYYNVNQALVGIKNTRITQVRSIADLKSHKLGVQVGTTSYDYVNKNIKPDKKPSVYSNSNDVNSGLKSGGVEGIVTDLPTAFYITGAEQVPNSVIVGQFSTVGTPEHFSLVLPKDSALTACMNKALADLRADGTLARLQNEWLANKGSAPVLK